jgi:hypothetical protein
MAQNPPWERKPAGAVICARAPAAASSEQDLVTNLGSRTEQNRQQENTNPWPKLMATVLIANEQMATGLTANQQKH